MPKYQLIPTRRFSVFGLTDETAPGKDGHSQGRRKCRTDLKRSGDRDIFERAAETARVDDAAERGGVDIPCMRLRELNRTNASRFVGLMEKHGFVVLKDVGPVQHAYTKLMSLLKAFFDGASTWKGGCKGAVYFNERGIPMWHAGYERCGEVREAFRIPASLSPSRAQPPWPCPVLREAWLDLLRLLQLVCHRALTLALGRAVPSAPSLAGTRNTRKGAMAVHQGHKALSECICDVHGVARVGTPPDLTSKNCDALDAAPGVLAGENGLGRSRSGDARPDCGSGGFCLACCDGCHVPTTGEARATTVNTEAKCREQRRAAIDDSMNGTEDLTDAGARRPEDDFSVSYALHYPNTCADPALEDQDLTVGEHVDPSLFVVEPCCGVEGLEIRDRASGRWLPVEAACAGLGGALENDDIPIEAEGRELILFSGKALERASGARIKGAPHRVRRSDRGRRYCFIYEQKYTEFFPPPALD